jgi:hypothetical protein
MSVPISDTSVSAAGADLWHGVEEVDGSGQKRIGTLLKLALNLGGRTGYRLV